MKKAMNFSNKQKVLLLRICFWYGAIIDAIWCVPMIIPEIGLALFGNQDLGVSIELRYSLAVGASLMLGWTILLIWGSVKPIERKGVLFLTLIPVKICLDLASTLLVFSNTISLSRFFILYILYIFALVVTRDMKKN